MEAKAHIRNGKAEKRPFSHKAFSYETEWHPGPVDIPLHHLSAPVFAAKEQCSPARIDDHHMKKSVELVRPGTTTIG